MGEEVMYHHQNPNLHATWREIFLLALLVLLALPIAFVLRIYNYFKGKK